MKRKTNSHDSIFSLLNSDIVLVIECIINNNISLSLFTTATNEIHLSKAINYADSQTSISKQVLFI